MHDFSETSLLIERVANGHPVDTMIIAFAHARDIHIELHQLIQQPDVYLIVSRSPDRVLMVIADETYQSVCEIFFSFQYGGF